MLEFRHKDSDARIQTQVEPGHENSNRRRIWTEFRQGHNEGKDPVTKGRLLSITRNDILDSPIASTMKTPEAILEEPEDLDNVI